MNKLLQAGLRKSLFFFGVLLLTGSMAAQPHHPTPGEVLLREGRYQAALDWTAERLSTDSLPELARLYNLRGNALRRQGAIEAAIAAHQKALELRQRHFGRLSVPASNSYQNLGNCYLDLHRTDRALSFLHQARKIRESNPAASPDDLASVYNSLGAAYRQQKNYDRAERVLRRALAIRTGQYGRRDSSLAPLLLNLSSVLLDRQKPLDACELLDELLTVLAGASTADRPLQALAHNNMGYCQYQLGRPEAARQFHQQAVGLVEGSADHYLVLADCLVGLGQCYLNLAEPAEAEPLLRQALSLYERSPQPDPLKIADVANDLGLCYRQMERYEAAVGRHEQAIGLYLDQGEEKHPNLTGFYFNLAQCYAEQGMAAAARSFFEAVLRGPATGELPLLARLHLGQTFLLEKRPAEALKHFQLARQSFARQASPDPFFRHFLDYAFGLAQSQAGDYGAAERSFEQALAIIDASGSGRLFPYEQARILTAQGYALQRRGRLLPALEVYRRAEALTRSMKASFRNQRSGLYLQGNFFDLYHRLVDLCFQLSEKDRQYAALAFRYAEAYKAAHLRWLLQRSRARSFAGVPDSLVQLEKQLQRERAFYARRCRETEADLYAGPQAKTECYRQLRSINDQLALLEERLQHQYPAYANLRRQASPPDIEATRRWLTPHQALLEYTLTDSMLYTFVLTTDTLVLLKQELPPDFVLRVEELYNLLNRSPRAFPDPAQASARYAALAHQLYRQLIQPAAPYLREELIVIPDGILCYFPFDALLVRPADKPHLFARHDYLVRHHAISYGYAAALLRLMREQAPAGGQKQLLAFAPSFDTHPFLPPLDFNAPEAEAISRMIPGKNFAGEAAHKSRFLALAPHYRLLHLATHSSLDHQTPDNSFLAFHGDGATHNLYLPEVYGLSLSADLVTLSACQTGVGRLRRGEGLISMARAFAYAGAKSIVASLWSIDDEQSNKIMQLFYRELVAGKAKDRALANSKLAYLDEAPHARAHPYYWAALTTIGDQRPVSGLGGFSRYWWLAAAAAIVGTAWLLKKRR